MDDVAWKDVRRNVCFSFTSVSTLVICNRVQVFVSLCDFPHEHLWSFNWSKCQELPVGFTESCPVYY